MKKTYETVILKEMLREQLYCLGRIFAKYEVGDNVIWEVVKGFDLILQNITQKIETSKNSDKSDFNFHKKQPHPGLIYLLEKLNKD